jgi:hypothetical protein
VGHTWFALCYRDFWYHAGGKDITELSCITLGASYVDAVLSFCGLM